MTSFKYGKLVLIFFQQLFCQAIPPNDLIIVRNDGDDDEDERDIKRVLERQEDAHIMVEIQSSSEIQCLTSSPTRSSGPHRLHTDVQEAYKIVFGRSAYARKEAEINFKMGPVPSPNNIGFDQNCQNSFNIQSPTSLGTVHIKTDAQVTYDIQLGHSWTHWKDRGKEIMFPRKLVPCLNSSRINRNHQNNWTSRIYLGAMLPFLAFGPCIMSSPLGLHPGGYLQVPRPFIISSGCTIRVWVSLRLIC
jgi:hypothetical protein